MVLPHTPPSTSNQPPGHGIASVDASGQPPHCSDGMCDGSTSVRMPAVRVDFQVGNMTCGKCVGRVERALKAVPGVIAVEVQLAEGKVAVQGEADLGSMLAALEDGGYPAQVAGSAGAPCAVTSAMCSVITQPGMHAQHTGTNADTRLTVSNMTCGKCVGRVERALEAVPGVCAVSVDLASGTACVTGGRGAGCPTMFVMKLIAALEEGGYPTRIEGAEGEGAGEGAKVGGTVEKNEPFQTVATGCKGGSVPQGFGGEWGLDVNWEQVG